MLGLVTVSAYRPVFNAGATLGIIGVVGSLMAAASTPTGGVAGAAASLVLLAPMLPRFATLQGGLPTPEVPNPAHGQVNPAPLPNRADLAAMVKRSDELLVGVLCGASAALAGCVLMLGRSQDFTTVILGYLLVVILLLRMRMFVALRHRLPLGLAGLFGLVALLVEAWSRLDHTSRGDFVLPVLIVLLMLASAAMTIGSALARRPPSPGLGRLGDVIEVLCVIATPVMACAVMGLFGLIRSLLNG